MDTNDNIVVVKNRKTNLVLDHYGSESMKAEVHSTLLLWFISRAPRSDFRAAALATAL